LWRKIEFLSSIITGSIVLEAAVSLGVVVGNSAVLSEAVSVSRLASEMGRTELDWNSSLLSLVVIIVLIVDDFGILVTFFFAESVVLFVVDFGFFFKGSK